MTNYFLFQIIIVRWEKTNQSIISTFHSIIHFQQAPNPFESCHFHPFTEKIWSLSFDFFLFSLVPVPAIVFLCVLCGCIIILCIVYQLLKRDMCCNFEAGLGEIEKAYDVSLIICFISNSQTDEPKHRCRSYVWFKLLAVDSQLKITQNQSFKYRPHKIYERSLRNTLWHFRNWLRTPVWCPQNPEKC